MLYYIIFTFFLGFLFIYFFSNNLYNIFLINFKTKIYFIYSVIHNKESSQNNHDFKLKR